MAFSTRPKDNGTFLIMEDDPDDTLLLDLAFARAGLHGISLRFTPDGRQTTAYIAGIDRYADRSTFPIPALLLLDLSMPGFSGFELLRWLNSNRELVRFPVIIFSGSDNPEHHRKATSFDFVTGYILKSPAFTEIPALLMQHLATWRNGSSRHFALPE
jgi:CheY-like chemotaxis protein